MKNILASFLIGLLGVAGCGDNASNNNTDMATGVSDMAGGAPDLATTGSDMAGDGGVTTQPTRIGDGWLEAVDPTQTHIAYLAPGYARVTGTATEAGTLFDTALATGSTPVMVSAGTAAFGANYGTDALVFSENATKTTDANQIAVYGDLDVWKPAFAKAVRVSTANSFVTRHISGPAQDYMLYFESATPSAVAAGDVYLWRTIDCTAVATCPVKKLTVAQGTFVNFAASFDGKWAAFAINTGTTNVATYFVDITNQTATSIATNANSVGSLSFSPDSKLFATVGTAGALTVFTAAATPTPVTWMPPAASTIEQVAFASATDLYVRARDANQAQTIYKTTAAAAATALVNPPVTAFFLPRPTVALDPKYLFAQTAVTAGTGDLVEYDLATAKMVGTMPVATKASPIGRSLVIASDSAYVGVIDPYDVATSTGPLVAIKTADATTKKVATKIFDAADAFIARQLFFIDDGTSPTGTLGWTNGTQSGSVANGVGNYRARGMNLYFTVVTADTLNNFAPGIWVEARP
jgi:hypothetical protein